VRNLGSAKTTSDLVVLKPTKGIEGLAVHEVVEYRELLFFLVWRDVKVRYKQTFIGVLWAVLRPLLTVAVFTLLFSRFAGIETNGVPYPIFSLAGVLPWTFFAEGMAQSINSLVGSSQLITKVYFPRILIPTASILAGAVDLSISMVVLIGMMALYGISPTVAIIWLPAVLFFVFAVALAMGTWLSAMNVRYRDFRYAVPFMIQIGLFVSPVIYSASEITERLESIGVPGWFYGLNPMVGVIESFRWSVFGGTPQWNLILTSGVVTVCGMFLALIYFRRVERSFADII
jgi:lipopolysaccharide transport system permease protein